ncbi:hypothetical protein C8Q76DRAFT_791694 [Earliella scabrosa]|nr:hypothetical protein C8Q76DRAFT_791694 [Earliella scabrosa]
MKSKLRRSSTQTETIVDFDFRIELAAQISVSWADIQTGTAGTSKTSAYASIAPPIDVKFEIIHNKIRVRSDSWLSRMLLHTAMKVLLWILLIYPFLWLYKRYGRRGGDRLGAEAHHVHCGGLRRG